MQSSASNPYIYYNMKLEDIIKRGTSEAAEEAARGSTLGIPMCKRARLLYTHTLGLLSSRYRLCRVPHQEEVHLSRHLPQLPGAAGTGDLPHHGPRTGPVESQICVCGGSCCPGTQAGGPPFPTQAQSLVSTIPINTCHLSAEVSGFRAALKGGVGYALLNSSWGVGGEWDSICM